MFGLLLQGCRPSFQVTSEEPASKKSRKTSDDAPIPDQVSVPDVLSSVVSGVPHSGLPTAASATSTLVAISTDQAASLTHRLAVENEVVYDREQTSSMEPGETQETDTKSVARPIAQVAELSSADRPESSRATPFSVPAPVFGAAEWARYLGEVGAEPSLPSNIAEILDSPCPFWPDRLVKDTHLLVLIPAAVDSEPFSLNLLGELVKSPKSGGYATKYRYYTSDTQAQHGAQSPGTSYWVLMTRDVLEGSRGRTYASQQALVATHASRTGLRYELPGALEAATVILSHYVRSGERLYPNSPWTYTRCQELVEWSGQSGISYPVAVGGLSSRGIDVCSGNGDYRAYGVAGLRKF